MSLEEEKKITEQKQDQVKATRDLVNESKENLRFTRDINSEIREGLKLIKGEADLRSSTLKALKEANNLIEDQIDLAKAGSKALMDSNKLRDKQLTFQKNISKLTANADDLAKKRILEQRALRQNMSKMSDEDIKKAQEQIDLSLQTERALRGQVNNQKENKKLLDQQVAAAEELDSLGSNRLFGSLAEIAGAIPGADKLTKGFDKAAEASKKIGADLLQKKLEDGKDASFKLGEALTVGFKGAAAGANELLKAFGPIAIIGKLVQGMFKADKSAGELAKNLNISTSEGGKLSGELIKVAQDSDKIGVTYNGVKHSLVAINQELGTSAKVSKSTLETFSQLETVAGLTQEEMKGIRALTFSTGKEADKLTAELMTQAKVTGLQNGVLLNEKEILKDISNVSAATTLSLGKNPKLLGEAVATAKALGIEFGKLENIADSLLDFETSIEKELEAELLLGKNLNLEKARQAALNNDLATLASEIADQAGSAAEFSKMNRIEQQALADAVGMSREDLAQTLFTQEQLKGLSKDQAEIEKAKLDDAIEKFGLNAAMKAQEEGTLQTLFDQASEQEKMKMASEEINIAFMKMGKSLLPVFETITNITTIIAENIKLVGTLIGLYGVVNTVLTAQKIIQAQGNKERIKELLLGKSKLAQLAAQAVAFALANPFRALAGVAAAATVGAIAYNALGKADDFVQEPMGGNGYGRTLLSPKGSLAINDGDTIIAGTNLEQGGNNTTAKVDMTETNTLLRQILSKQGTVSLDAEKMGTAISMNTYEISP